jgi:membrane protease YdiL (CAAX protease family)
MAIRPTARARAGPLVFVALTLALTWTSAWLLASAPVTDGPVSTRLLRASLVYVAAVGWQPLAVLLLVRRVVDRGWLDRGGHAMTTRYLALGIGLPIVLLIGAALVDSIIGPSVRTQVGPSIAPTWIDSALAVSAFLGVLAVLWAQAIIEEVAWRGYLLPRLMRAVGPWGGLLLHGLLWGACYAPVLLVGAAPEGPWRAACFVVTCGLLGALLGWLRLASGSIAASATCNATLTICAGLPLVLQDMTPPILGAVFGPAGWLPMLLVIVVVACRPSLRAAVVTPVRPVASHLN